MRPKTYIDLTERLKLNSQSRLEWLESQMAKRDIRGVALFSHLKSPPETLSAATIKNWLENKAEGTLWQNWIAVKHGIRSYPVDWARVHLDTKLTSGSKSRREWLREELEQKSIRPAQLYKHIEPSVDGFENPRYF